MAIIWSLVAMGLFPQNSVGLKPALSDHIAYNVETIRQRAASCPPEEDGRVTNIYYINVDSQNIRRKHMEKMLNNKSLVDECISIHRLSAVEPQEGEIWDGWAAEKFAPEGCAYHRRDAGRKRCSNDLTHRIAFDQCTKHKGFCLVLEDDAVIKKGWHDTFLKELDDVPKNWTLIKLGSGGHRSEDDRLAGTRWFLSNRRPGYAYNGSFAMILDRKRARAMLDLQYGRRLQSADGWTALPGSYIYETNLIDRAPLTSNINNDGVSEWGTQVGHRVIGPDE